jgi:hypothetical protein
MEPVATNVQTNVNNDPRSNNKIYLQDVKVDLSTVFSILTGNTKTKGEWIDNQIELLSNLHKVVERMGFAFSLKSEAVVLPNSTCGIALPPITFNRISEERRMTAFYETSRKTLKVMEAIRKEYPDSNMKFHVCVSTDPVRVDNQERYTINVYAWKDSIIDLEDFKKGIAH